MTVLVNESKTEAGNFPSINSERETSGESLMMVTLLLSGFPDCSLHHPLLVPLLCLQYMDWPCLEPSPEHLFCAYLHPVPDD